MRKFSFILFICVLSIGMAVFLSSCGCGDDSNGILSGLFGDSFSDSDQEIIESVVNGSAYQAYENGELDDDYYENYNPLPEGTEAMSLDDIPRESLEELIEEGRDFLISKSKTDKNWTERWYAGNGNSGPYKTLEAVDYVGSYFFTDSATYSEDELYLVYKVRVIQAGSSSKQDADYISSARTEFEYFWYVSVSGKADYETRTFSFGTRLDECVSIISFDTYSLGGFDTISTISKEYYGYRTIEEIYNDIVSADEEGYTLLGSTM